MHISRLFIYPVKSCAPVEVDRLHFDQYGPVGDRRFMVVSPEGRFLTQRQLPQMAFIRPSLTVTDSHKIETLTLSAGDVSPLHISLTALDNIELTVTVWKDSLAATDCGDVAAEWLSSLLGKPCRLVMLQEGSQRQVSLKRAKPGRFVGFADGYPLLVTTQASIDYISAQVGREVAIERFRPNVLVAGDFAAFSELKWQAIECAEGRVELVKPCERCVIPTRDLETQQREADVLEALKQHCRVDGKIIFGQNGIDHGLAEIRVGDTLTAV
jgi:hypothetical protein